MRTNAWDRSILLSKVEFNETYYENKEKDENSDTQR